MVMTWSDGLVAAVDGSGLIKMNEPLAVVERKPEEGLSRMAFWGKQRSASRVRWEVSLPKATATVECVRPPYRTPDGTSWTFFFPVEVSAEALRAVMLAGAGRGQVGLWDPRKPCQIGPGATPNPWRGLLTPRHVSAWWVGMGARPSKGMWPRASCVVGSGAAQGSLRTHHRFISLIRSFKEIYF